ncbi:hypothetical protein E3N88_40610 [Mikania micrantha]|uniref:Uncharacterized protein n=1 Tax=Mikania micrantha TaxID=192012 RepID=A0A5N6LN30_9ASTR|nr:hypothetical protein E3N88_40610 [Mikania micrantha]
MRNMGENRVQNEVMDVREFQNEVSVEKWKKWSSRLLFFSPRYAKDEAVEKVDSMVEISDFHHYLHFLASCRRNHHHIRKFHHPIHKTRILKPLERLDRIRERLYESRSSFYLQNSARLVSKVLIRELYQVNPCAAEQEPLIVLLADNPFAWRIASPLDNVNLCAVISVQVSHTSSLRHHHYASATISEYIVTSSQVTRGGGVKGWYQSHRFEYSVYTAMADQGERYIYQRFPYVVLDDTPSSSSDSDSDPSEVSAAVSQANVPAPVQVQVPVPVPAPVPASLLYKTF